MDNQSTSKKVIKQDMSTYEKNLWLHLLFNNNWQAYDLIWSKNSYEIIFIIEINPAEYNKGSTSERKMYRKWW